MNFYEQLSVYYDYIFPLKQNQLSFIVSTIGSPNKDVIDIACGTGNYSIALAKEGYDVTAIDLDKEMVNKIMHKANENKVNIEIIRGDMLSLSQILSHRYDHAFCIGNSLVHLTSYTDILNFIKSVHLILQDEGSLILQIINYDRIIENNIHHLPTIEVQTPRLFFERMYTYDKDMNIIHFITTLKVNEEEFVHTVQLLPILHDELLDIIKEAGFKSIKTYGDFEYSPYNKNESYALVINANK